MNSALWVLYRSLGWIEDDPDAIAWTKKGVEAAAPFLFDLAALCFDNPLPRPRLAELARRGLIPATMVPVDPDEERAKHRAAIAAQRQERQALALAAQQEKARQRKTVQQERSRREEEEAARRIQVRLERDSRLADERARKVAEAKERQRLAREEREAQRQERVQSAPRLRKRRRRVRAAPTPLGPALLLTGEPDAECRVLSAHLRSRLVGQAVLERDGTWSCRLAGKTSQAAFGDMGKAEAWLRANCRGCSIVRTATQPARKFAR